MSTVTAALELLSASDLDGELWTAERLRGRVVLLDFWATWCAPCLAELPRLQKLREQYSRSDFEILGISLDAIDRRAFVSWLNRHRIDWPQIHERGGYGGPTARLFGIDKLPTTILVDRDGSVAAIDVRGDRLSALIADVVQAGGQATAGSGRTPAGAAVSHGSGPGLCPGAGRCGSYDRGPSKLRARALTAFREGREVRP